MQSNPVRFLLVLFSACAAPSAFATSTTYTINFTSEAGPLPAAGSFTFDPSHGFSAFTVSDEGVTYDLTNSANNPFIGAPRLACLGTDTGYQAGWDFMSGKCGGAPQDPASGWFFDAASILGPATFQFIDRNVFEFEGEVISATSSATGGTTADGWFTISPAVASVPEPSTQPLLLTLVSVAIVGQKRIAQILNSVRHVSD